MADTPTSPPPAYFLSLSLENVRSFGAKQTISFARPDGRPAQWTIILGDNGVGKTTVLRSLAAMVLEPHPLANLKQVFDTSSWTAALYRLTNPFAIKWWPYRGEGQSHILLGAVTIIGEELSSSKWDSAIREEFRVQKTPINDNEIGVMSSSGNISPISKCHGYGAGRSVGVTTLSESDETVDTCASLFDDRADLLNPEEWFLFADYRMAKDKDPLTTQNFNLIKAALLKIMEEGEVTDLEVAPVQSGGGSPRQGVRFRTPYGWVRLRDMSLGYQTLVVWLTDLADKLFVRYPNSKNPLAEPAIVLIDEIDLHLHPSWQRKLLKSLSEIFVNTQFIATAHSPLIVQAAGDANANVVLLRREGDQTVVVQDLPDVRRWRIEQILNSELFDDTSPLSPQTEADLTRRNALLLKTRLTAKEKAELAELNAAVEAQPVGTTGPERRVEDLLARLARNLGPEGLLK